MGTWAFSRSDGCGVRIPLSDINCLRLVFPAEKLVHRSRGIDRSLHLPTRFYDTPEGPWFTDDPTLLRLLHSDLPFLIERVARLPSDREIIAGSTNYGSNPYYCIRRPLCEQVQVPLFHLEQERLDELHAGMAISTHPGDLHIEAVRVRFDPADRSAIDAVGRRVPDEALVLTAPEIVWNGEFAGWPSYARSTYDCRHVVNLQYVDRQLRPDEFERARAEIQRLQQLWTDRDRYVDEVLRLAESLGYASYQRLVLGFGRSAGGQYLLLTSVEGTAEAVARQLLSDCPDLVAAFQITEGGGTGIVAGATRDWSVLGSSSYRRGRVLCCLLVELG